MKINSKILLYLTLIAFTGCSKANDPSPFPPTPIAKDPLLGDWQKIDAGLNHMEDIIFLNPQKGYLCGPDGIYSSNDSGKSWNLTTATGAFYNLFFLNPQTGYVLGATEFAYTMDGGTTWIKKRIPIPNIPTTEHLRDLFFVSPSTGYLTARFGLYKTTDTGNTWQVNISLNSNGIFFLDST